MHILALSPQGLVEPVLSLNKDILDLKTITANGLQVPMVLKTQNEIFSSYSSGATVSGTSQSYIVLHHQLHTTLYNIT